MKYIPRLSFINPFVSSVLALCSAIAIAGCGAAPYAERSSREIAPGVVYTQYHHQAPNEIHVVTVDLKTPGLSIESARRRGLVPTSKIVQAVSTPDRPVVAAINADFFSFTSRWPVGIQLHAGEIWTGLPTFRSHLLITTDGRPMIERITLNASAAGSNGRSWKIDALNQPLPRSGSAFYTPRWYDSTSGKGVRLKRAASSWKTEEPMRMVVDSVGAFDKVNLGDDHGLLLFSTRTIDSLGPRLPKLNDTIQVTLGLAPSFNEVGEALGGAGRLVVDGKPCTLENIQLEHLSKDFIERRHPRTFVGFDRDTTRLFLCVVDGRQESSVGMSFQEMADFLIFLGVDNAFNFDGGGSTTMVVDGKIVNSPSDKGGERAVANALVVRVSRLPN